MWYTEWNGVPVFDKIIDMSNVDKGTQVKYFVQRAGFLFLLELFWFLDFLDFLKGKATP